MSTFDNVWQRKQEIASRPYVDQIYKFWGAVDICRFEEPDGHELDKHFAIDVVLTMSNGMILTGQEKFLSRRWAYKKTATVEYEQNQFTGEQGDWYKLAPQFYFVGYICGEGFSPWIILNWMNVVIQTNMGLINWQRDVNKDGSAKASFKYFPMADFPDSCVFVRSF